jgi:GTPase
MIPRIAIIGRSNVGKSSIFNRILASSVSSSEQKKSPNRFPIPKAIISDDPGITRDGKDSGPIKFGSCSISIRDTPGLEEYKELVRRVMEESDAVLFVCDAKEGVTPLDVELTESIVRDNSNVILVVNKSGEKDSVDEMDTLTSFYELGLGDPVLLSAKNNCGFEELADRLESVIIPQDNQENSTAAEDQIASEIAPLRVGFVGRPNTGKSSLLNAILQKDRCMTDSRAGTTTDSISVPFLYNQVHNFILTDTAGVNRNWKFPNEGTPLEEVTMETRRAMNRSDVTVIVADAMEIANRGIGLSKVEMQVGKRVAEMGKCVVLCVNKWDLISKSSQKRTLRKAIQDKVDSGFAQLRGMPVVYVSARTGLNTNLLLNRIINVTQKWNTRIETSKLNSFLRNFILHHPPIWKDGMKCQIKYLTQTNVKPPTFVLWTNIHTDFPDNYLTLLQNTIREEFNLQGTPMIFMLRSTFVPKKIMKHRMKTKRKEVGASGKTSNSTDKKSAFFDVV